MYMHSMRTIVVGIILIDYICTYTVKKIQTICACIINFVLCFVLFFVFVFVFVLFCTSFKTKQNVILIFIF